MGTLPSVFHNKILNWKPNIPGTPQSDSER